jgi:DNA-binding MarR family transcriptional regulator
LVVREKCDKDSRGVNLKLSSKGEEALTNIWECLNEFFNRLTEEIPEHKRESVFEGVSLFAKAVKTVFGQCSQSK